MKCKFVSLEVSGNGADFIMTIEQELTVWRWLAGGHTEVVEFFGPRPAWVTMDGMKATPRMQRMLDGFWNAHLPAKADWRGTHPWEVVEPAAN